MIYLKWLENKMKFSFEKNLRMLGKIKKHKQNLLSQEPGENKKQIINNL